MDVASTASQSPDVAVVHDVVAAWFGEDVLGMMLQLGVVQLPAS